ncbi:MAG: hypothetical protein NUV59_00450 [Patescibacteria group bacterium]|nr:hypothetical protein [Patescibacteria group bacterium]
MTKNPLANAVLAAGYIVLVASLLYYGPKLAGSGESALVPVAMLSLFVLSAALMGYIFFYHPAILYMDGEKQLAVKLFMQTLGAFALLTLLFLVLAFFIL